MSETAIEKHEDEGAKAFDAHLTRRLLRYLRPYRVRAAFSVVLDDGRIIERGTHEQLVDRGGYYADLYRRQTIEDELEEIA